MLKRLFSLFILGCLVAMMIPTGVQAGSTIKETIGDFYVTYSIMSESPIVDEGSLVITSPGVYKIQMASGKTSTSQAINVTASDVTLNMDAVVIQREKSFTGVNGFWGMKLKDGTNIRLLSDCFMTGGDGGDENDDEDNPTMAANGGAGIVGNFILSGNGALTVTGGRGGTGLNVPTSGPGIQGDVTVTGSAKLVASGGFKFKYGQGVTGTITAPDLVVKGGYDLFNLQEISANSPAYIAIVVEEPAFTSAVNYAATSPSEGDFSIDYINKTITINSARGAAWWCVRGEEYFDYKIILANDIDVSMFRWDPVGDINQGFTGTFEGNGHTISGLNIRANGDNLCLGMLGKTVGAQIRNLGLKDISIKASTETSAYVGGFIGHGEGGTQLENCYISGAIQVSHNGTLGELNVGGLIGQGLNFGSKNHLSNCYSTATVAASRSGEITLNTGALVGNYMATDMDNCYYLMGAGVPDKGFTSASLDGCTITNCGRFSDSGGVLTPCSESQVGVLQTLSHGTHLLAALNGGVSALSSTAYYTWTADSNSSPANHGYPVLGSPWSAPQPGTISGVVKDSSGNPISGAVVSLEPSDPFLSTTTDGSGYYTISSVPNGYYNLVVENNSVKITDNVTMESAIVTKNMVFLNGKKNTVVETKSGTDPVSVGGMNDLLSTGNLDTTLTPEEKNKVDAGGTVEIKLVAEKKAEADIATDKGIIASIASGKQLGLFVDLSVLKNVLDSGGTVVSANTKITVLSNIISVTLPIPTELQGKSGFAVYRVHNGVAQVLQKDTPDANGEYYTISGDGKFITLYVKNFSTYAMGYTASTGGTSGGGSSGGGGSSSSTHSYTITASASEGGTINPSGSLSVREGNSQVYSLSPQSGYQLKDVLVDGKSVGTKVDYTFTSVQGAHTIQGVFSKIETAKPEDPVKFKDVTVNDWFYNAVVNGARNQWFHGTADNAFNPSQSTTRGMIATVLWRMENQPKASGSIRFDDVEKELWYSEGISWAQEHGIVKGYGNGKFGPQDVITREQMASILYRYASFKGIKPQDSATLQGFSDGEAVSDYAKPAVAWAVGKGIITGVGNQNLAPKHSATRAEVATILTRFQSALR